MFDEDAKVLAEMARAAVEWRPKAVDVRKDVLGDLDVLSEKLSREDAEQHPITVHRCCRECAFLNIDTCENFRPPRSRQTGKLSLLFRRLKGEKLRPSEGHSERRPGESIPIPRELQTSIYCEAWIEVELAKLLLMGNGPSGIAYSRRHPRVEIPRAGARGFAEHLAAVRRVEDSKQAESRSADDQEIEWPEMDGRLREVLMNVELRGNQEMWSEYQGHLFLMDWMSYINSMFDVLQQKPESPIGRFFKYVIETHGYFYRDKFAEAGERGARTFERVLGFLTNQSLELRETAIELLGAIYEHSYGKKPPEEPTDQAAWQEWAGREFGHAWTGARDIEAENPNALYVVSRDAFEQGIDSIRVNKLFTGLRKDPFFGDIPDDHLRVLIYFSFAMRQEAQSGLDLDKWLPEFCNQYKKGRLVIAQSRGKYVVSLGSTSSK